MTEPTKTCDARSTFDCTPWFNASEKLPPYGTSRLCQFKIADGELLIGVCRLEVDNFVSEWIFNETTVAVSRWCDLSVQRKEPDPLTAELVAVARAAERFVACSVRPINRPHTLCYNERDYLGLIAALSSPAVQAAIEKGE